MRSGSATSPGLARTRRMGFWGTASRVALGLWLVTPERLEATGWIAHCGQVILFAAMLLTPDQVPALWFTADTALLFYGGAMLLAAVLDQSDCEVLALSNRLLRREDRLGCMIFAPFDLVDRRLHR
jgi:Na+/H+ antiporter NhaD/arsenite permease-like protein